MSKKDKDRDLTCVFTPATRDAVIYRAGQPIIQGHDLRPSGGFWDRALGIKPGEFNAGIASIPGVGDPTKSTTSFLVETFRNNAATMTCSVPDLGIKDVPARIQNLPPNSPSAPTR